MHICLLGIVGPWQLLILLVIIGIVALVITLVVKNNRNKAQDEALDRIERLNQMRESGALTQQEFEAEKKKLLR